MKSQLLTTSVIALACLCIASQAVAQSPSVLYTWPGTGNTQAWIRAFGDGSTSATLANGNIDELTITETSAASGESQAFSDGFNRVRESPAGPNGGLDLTGLDYLEFDIGHNSVGNTVMVQFFTQSENPCCNYDGLGVDVAVASGVNTYQVPLSGLAANEIVYIRTLGFNARDHVTEGNLVWTLREVRSGGTPLTVRDLVTHNNGTEEGGLEGAIVNFGNASVQGNTGQNQTGLSHDSSGSGSLQWTDVAGGAGGAISWGNGTEWAGNGFNNRTTDLSNYTDMLVRISATDPNNGGGLLGFNSFFQKNSFTEFSNPEGGAGRNIPIDGQFHTVRWSLAGLTNMNVVDQTGIDLFGHAQNLVINVDRVRFIAVPEPASLALLAIAMFGCMGVGRRANSGR